MTRMRDVIFVRASADRHTCHAPRLELRAHAQVYSHAMSEPSNIATLEDAQVLVDATRRLTEQALRKTSTITQQGQKIDEHQVLVDRVAYAATEARAAAELLAAAHTARAASKPDKLLEGLAIAGWPRSWKRQPPRLGWRCAAQATNRWCARTAARSRTRPAVRAGRSTPP
jgi:hypothetical protein